MNGNILKTGALVLLAVVVVAFFAATFVVQQTQQALVLQFGRVRTVVTEPGLYLKWPFIENVVALEKRVLDLDLPVQTVLSADRQNLEVDAFARYRISNPLEFFQTVSAVGVANQRLGSFVNASMRNVLANASRDAIVRTERGALMNRIQEDVNRQAQNLGVEIIDLRLTRVDLPAANSQAVYQRMQTERQREAADLRANGQQQAATIRARAEREATVIVARGELGGPRRPAARATPRRTASSPRRSAGIRISSRSSARCRPMKRVCARPTPVWSSARPRNSSAISTIRPAEAVSGDRGRRPRRRHHRRRPGRRVPRGHQPPPPRQVRRRREARNRPSRR